MIKSLLNNKMSLIFLIAILLFISINVNASHVYIDNYDGTEMAFNQVKEIIDAGNHPFNIYESSYNLPLPLFAVAREDKNLINLLSYYETDFNWGGFNIQGEFYSPLSFYVSLGGQSIEIFDLLIDSGMNIYRESTGRNAVYHAAKNNNLAALDYLLNLGVDPNPIVESKSPIRSAAANNNFKAVSKLLDFNADIFFEDENLIMIWEYIKDRGVESNDPFAEEANEKVNTILNEITSRTAVSISQGQRLLNYPESFIGQRLSGLNFKYGILDFGFKGLKDWLETHPEEKQLTHIAEDTDIESSNHGYLVYRIVRKIAPDAEIYIGDAFKADHLIWLHQNDVKIASMSAGYFSWISPELDNAPDRLHGFVEVLEATGIYLFTASGNTYMNINSSYVQDENNSGWLNIGNEQHPDLQKFSVFKDREFEVYVASNFWEVPHDLDVEVFLKRDDKFQLIENIQITETTPGNLKLSGIPGQSLDLYLRIKADNISPDLENNLIVRTHFRKNAKGFDLNGAESINSPANYYSPYIISVGSFGLKGDNIIIPSFFSSIGFNNYNLLPHVFGPGELIIDNQVIQGTSFSTPFIGAISTFSRFMSPKSLMREISSHDRWADNVPGKVRGAWGIPNAKNLLFSRAPAYDDEITVYGTTYRYSGADTEFFFNVNKNYADGMQFNFKLDLIDPVTQEIIIAKNTTHPFSLEKSVRADQGDFLEETVYFNIPGKFVPEKFLGEEVLVKVYASTELRKDRWVELDDLYSIITLNY